MTGTFHYRLASAFLFACALGTVVALITLITRGDVVVVRQAGYFSLGCIVTAILIVISYGSCITRWGRPPHQQDLRNRDVNHF